MKCGGAPDTKATPESYDEYTESLTNAVISSPSGIVLIGAADGGSAGPAGGGASAFGDAGGVSGGDDGGVSGGDDGGGGGGFGQWHFDDCSPESHFLLDSSGEGATAQHALGSACVPGISGLGVEIRSAKDVIQVPDEPQFTVGSRIAVAAWVNPSTVAGDQPIIIKRLNSSTSFSLGIHKGNIEMSVVLTTGTTYISSAPIPAGAWSHVAGMFDGTFLYLFLDGQQFGQVYAAGTIRDVFAPIRIGATSQTQYLHGIVDEVFISTQDITKDQLTALACIGNPSTFTVNPATSPPVPFDTTFHYDVAVTDNDVGFCASNQYDLFFTSFDPTINTVVDPPGFFPSVPPATTVTFGVDVTPSESATPGINSINFVVQDFGATFEDLSGTLLLNVAQPTGCFVFETRELMITDVSVVDDPVRAPPAATGGGGGSDAGTPVGPISPPGSPIPAEAGAAVKTASTDVTSAATDSGAPSSSQGVWTFGYLMRQLAPSAAQAPAMTENLFDNWLTDQTVNEFTVFARPAIQQQLLDIWPRTASGELDLDNAPMRLQAIVSRVDLRNLSAGSAGEGRFVFAVNDSSGFPQQFTVILEYNLPAKTEKDVLTWANLWHGLSSHPFPSEAYNAALETITRRFGDRNAAPGAVNGSALVSLRTNEIALSGIRWELREFGLSSTTKVFQEATVKETPDLSFNGTSSFASFVNANATALEAEVPGANDNTVPVLLGGTPFLAGSIFNDLIEWAAPGIASDDARFHASLNTCNGCHGPETNTTFLMITPRFPGSQASLSPF